MQERRKFKRLPMRGLIECTAAFESSGKTRKMPVLSLSAGGMYVALNERHDFDMTIGESLECIQFDVAELGPLVLKGFVAHRMSLGEVGGCGIEFESVRYSDTAFLEHYVEGKLAEHGIEAT